MLDEKFKRLKDILRQTQGCSIAYSGGVDSSLLVTVAHEVLSERCLAVLATSSTYPKREYDQAVRFIRERSIPLVTIVSEELDIPEFRDNPTNRCYYCKKELFGKIKAIAESRGLACVADGNNADDTRDFRPGMEAARELGVLSPLKEAGLTKEEIRQLARQYGLPMAEKPPMACLASRFPYGLTITAEKLEKVERIEDFLHNRDFCMVRARYHETILRLELAPQEMQPFITSEARIELIHLAKELGFYYITMDLEGYRTGSMNEVNDSQSHSKRGIAS